MRDAQQDRRPAMGMLVNGVWQQEDPPSVSADGSFVRPESGFRDRVTRDGSSGFKAEPGRYYLVTAPSCPWAHRTVLMRNLKEPVPGLLRMVEACHPPPRTVRMTASR
jgi:glutathionyl-hydroquinone reductase